MSPNLGANPKVFCNKNLEDRKNLLKRATVPRRDSLENLSFWTRDVKKKFDASQKMRDHERPSRLSNLTRPETDRSGSMLSSR